MSDDSPKSPPTPPFDAGEDAPAAPMHPPDEAAVTPWSNGDLNTAWLAARGLTPEDVRQSRRALVVWFYILLAFGVGGVLLGQEEMALLVAVSGVVIAAHAADFHPRFEPLYRTVSVVLIGMCGATLFALAAFLRHTGLTGPLAIVIPLVSLLSGLVMLATGIPALARALTRALFGAQGDSHSGHLAARLTLFGFVAAVPLWFAAQSLLDNTADTKQLFANLTLGGAVFGDVILALAAVGFLVRRDLRATLERLGLTRPRARDLLLVVIGVPIMWGLNAACEWAQQHWFHSLWEADRRVNEALASVLDRRGMVMLSLGAGIGEEITMRGALQPKLGLLRTSLFFAALHVQYSWFGMATVFGFGLLLGTIRRRSNTAVAMAVHGLYDLVALLTA